MFLEISKKAFYTVDHNILTQKLKYYGVRGIVKDWFSSYLNNREQYVSIKSYSTKTIKIIAEVLQGSVCGALLFLIDTNVFNKCIKHSKAYHFTDDTNILPSNASLIDLA